MQYLGIDPGVSGGLAVLSESGDALWVCKMPATDRELLELLGEQSAKEPTRGLIEKLGGMPRENGRAKQSPTTMFKMGRNYGALHMALAAAGIPYSEILPRAWQMNFGLLRAKSSESQTGKKNRHKQMAQQLFPTLKITHATADALLIAHYCRWVERQL